MNGPPTWCDLWVLAEDDVDAVADRLEAHTQLAPDEIDRLTRLLRPASRRRHLGARILARWALARYVDATPAQLRFGHGEFGRPLLIEPTSRLDFNLTHTEGIIACAVTPRGPVGVDAEPWPARPTALHIVDQVLTERERHRLEAAPAEQQAAVLAEHWVLKEAYTKALGLGLHRQFTSFEIGVDDRDDSLAGHLAVGRRAVGRRAPTVHDPHTDPAPDPDWALRLLRCGASHVMALAAPTTGIDGEPAGDVWLDVIDAARVLAGLPSSVMLPAPAELTLPTPDPAIGQVSGAGQSLSRHRETVALPA